MQDLPPPHGEGRKGISLALSTVRRAAVDSATAQIKLLNYLPSILGKLAAARLGVDGVVMLDARGFVAEALVANVFVVRDGRVATPATSSGILEGGLGLEPRQHTTGGRPKLLGISKRGNAYVRTMLIHGARAALPTMAKADDVIGGWLRGLLARSHRNVVVVALAAKLARIAWSTLRSATSFARQPAVTNA